MPLPSLRGAKRLPALIALVDVEHEYAMKKINGAVAEESKEAKRLRTLTTACTAAAHAAAAHSAVAQAAAVAEMVYTPVAGGS